MFLLIRIRSFPSKKRQGSRVGCPSEGRGPGVEGKSLVPRHSTLITRHSSLDSITCRRRNSDPSSVVVAAEPFLPLLQSVSLASLQQQSVPASRYLGRRSSRDRS